MNAAYYTLHDAGRRREYDRTRTYERAGTGRAETGAGGSSWQDAQFADVFEEMMNEEGLRGETVEQEGTGRFWGVIGALAGAMIGFIIANFAGLLAGAVLGNRLGAIRDRKGKSVYQVNYSHENSFLRVEYVYAFTNGDIGVPGDAGE